MKGENPDAIKQALKKIFKGIGELKLLSNNKREFTIDGRLVGDIGEVLAEQCYAITLYKKKNAPVHDAESDDGKKQVQIKATFKEHLTFTKVPDYYLGLKLHRDGSFEEIYNGPSSYISEQYKHRKGFGEIQHSFPIKRLQSLSQNIPLSRKIKKR